MNNVFKTIILTIYYYNFIVIVLCDVGFHSKHNKILHVSQVTAFFTCN